MHNVYAEKEIFETIVLYNEDYPNWNKIFCEHSEIYLNITDEDLILEEVDGTAIFEYIKANGGRSPVAQKTYFDEIYLDNSKVAEKPRSTFFLKYTREESEQLQSDYGVIVQSEDSIDDNTLMNGYFREFVKDEVCENGAKIGWHETLNFSHLPSNALVISDNYLFHNIEDIGGAIKNIGFENVIKLLDAVLPDVLNIDYHVTIITKTTNTIAWRNNIAGRLITEINNLGRGYNINIELVFHKSKHYHKRRLLMNYINASCDKGFSLFKVPCAKTVWSSNDLRFNRIFSNVQNILGDSEYNSATKGLQTIKGETQTLAAHITSGATGYLGVIIGGCNADKTLKNRLVNDV